MAFRVPGRAGTKHEDPSLARRVRVTCGRVAKPSPQAAKLTAGAAAARVRGAIFCQAAKPPSRATSFWYPAKGRSSPPTSFCVLCATFPVGRKIPASPPQFAHPARFDRAPRCLVASLESSTDTLAEVLARFQMLDGEGRVDGGRLEDEEETQRRKGARTQRGKGIRGGGRGRNAETQRRGGDRTRRRRNDAKVQGRIDERPEGIFSTGGAHQPAFLASLPLCVVALNSSFPLASRLRLCVFALTSSSSAFPLPSFQLVHVI